MQSHSSAAHFSSGMTVGGRYFVNFSKGVAVSLGGNILPTTHTQCT